MLPLRCCLCAEPLSQKPFTRVRVCPECLRQLFRERLPEGKGARRCKVCGMPLISEKDTCLECRDAQYYFKTHRSLVMYQDSAEALIRHFKFQPLPALALLWAHCFIHVFRTTTEQKALLVPVPARTSSVRHRGWDQMKLICRHLQRRGLPTAHLLQRTGGSPQKNLNYADRMSNLKGRIKCTQKTAPVPPMIVLLDDVFTTGATLNECARVLQSGGVQEIHSFTIAMTPY